MVDNIAVRVPLTVESLSIEDRIREANARKAEGTDHFRQGNWQEALSAYESAMGFLPKREVNSKDKQPHDSPRGTSDDDRPLPDAKASPSDSVEIPQGNLDPETEKACTSLRSVLNANVGACHVRLVSLNFAKGNCTNQIFDEGEHKQAVEACTRALLDDPNYVKALQRRATSNEQLDTWSSLSSAQEDYNTLLKLLPSGTETGEIQSKLVRLKPRLEMAQKRETTEMLGKLKTLGNGILGAFGFIHVEGTTLTAEPGNFGLSTDNFKFEPNGQGGYSVNFSR